MQDAIEGDVAPQTGTRGLCHGCLTELCVGDKDPGRLAMCSTCWNHRPHGAVGEQKDRGWSMELSYAHDQRDCPTCLVRFMPDEYPSREELAKVAELQRAWRRVRG